MIHRVEKGSNAGWSAFEGTQVFRAENSLGRPTRTHSPAIVQQPHTEMRSVIGGMFYRGEALPALRDHFLYACYFTKRLWAFSYKDRVPGKPFLVADSIGGVAAIAEGSDREPVITTHDGDLYFLKARAVAPRPRPWPEKLSATGLFTSVSGNELAPGVYPYLINASSWSDGARKQRFAAVAPGERLIALGGQQIDKSWEPPVGSALGQTFSLDGRRIETQLLYFDGTWRGYTYRWEADESEAFLVPDAGADAQIGGQNWHFSSRAECMVCHTHRSNFPLALTTRQLDRPGISGENQLDALIAMGLLQKGRSLEQQRGRPLRDPYNEAGGDLAERARSYLDLNCAHCHRETGLGGRAGFELLSNLSLEDTGIVAAMPTVGLLGSPEARIVAPGDPTHSELLGRMSRRRPRPDAADR